MADSTKVDAKSLEAVSPLHMTLFCFAPNSPIASLDDHRIRETIEEGGWRSSLRLGTGAARAPTLAGKGDIVRESNGVPHDLIHVRSASQNCDIFLTNN